MTRLDRLREMRALIDAEIEAELAGGIRALSAPVIEHVIERCAALYGVSPKEVTRRNRKAQPTRARHAAAWMLHHSGMSMTDVAHALGYRDHTPVVYACRKIDGSPATRALLMGLEVVA